MPRPQGPPDRQAGLRAPREPEEFVAKGGLTDLVETLSVGEPVTEIVTLHGTGTFEEKVPVEGKMTARRAHVHGRHRAALGQGLRRRSSCSFVNTIPTTEGGTHVAGFDRAMTKVVNDTLLAGTKKLATLAKSGKDRAEKGDVQEGLVAAIKVTFPEPQFKGQTKQELGTPGDRSRSSTRSSGTTSRTGSRAAARRPTSNALREKLTQAVINRVSTKATLEARRKAANLNAGGMPDKLADCRTHGPDAELLIVEGDSAAGPAKAGRNAEYMAVLPLRGKVVNAGKSTLKQVIENAEAQALFTAIGAGSGHGLQPRAGPLRPDHHPVRRRRRRQPHPVPAAHADLPVHAAAARATAGCSRPSRRSTRSRSATRSSTPSPTPTRTA